MPVINSSHLAPCDIYLLHLLTIFLLVCMRMHIDRKQHWSQVAAQSALALGQPSRRPFVSVCSSCCRIGTPPATYSVSQHHQAPARIKVPCSQ